MGNWNCNPGRVRASMAGAVLALAAFTGIAAAQPPLQPPEQPPEQPPAARVDVATGSNAPLTALSVTSGSVSCAQGSLVIGKNGKVGFLAPVIGPTVLRGSSGSGSAVSWAVVSLDGIGPEVINAVTTCLAAR